MHIMPYESQNKLNRNYCKMYWREKNYLIGRMFEEKSALFIDNSWIIRGWICIHVIHVNCGFDVAVL